MAWLTDDTARPEPLPEKVHRVGSTVDAMWPFSPVALEAWSSMLPSKCLVCGALLLGRYHINEWGDEWCESHPSPASCTWCGRMSDLTLDSGRYRCATCRATGVDGAAELAVLRPKVLEFVAGQVGPHALDRVPVAITGGTLTTHGSRRIGRTHTTYDADGASSRISLSPGMPGVLAGAVLAHEYGHVVLAVDPATLTPRTDPRLDLPTEEGFCEVLAWQWLTGNTDPDAAFHRRNIERSPDPVYGDGFRSARARLEVVGSVRALLDELRPRLRSSTSETPPSRIRRSGADDPHDPPVSRVRRSSFS